MLSKEAIQELSMAQSIAAAFNSVVQSSTKDYSCALVPLPNNFQINDLEKYMPNRRRMRGTMSTSVIADFARYCDKNAELGASIFIDPERMEANAVLNIGTPEEPGHADNTATLIQSRTAAYTALHSFANGDPLSQKDAAEFMEDWKDNIICSDDDGVIASNKAISAIRKISIESLRKIESEEKALSASKSAFESVEAKSSERIPTEIIFKCNPYEDLKERQFKLRLGVLTGNHVVPAINLRIVKISEHLEQMAKELEWLINAECTACADDGDHVIPVMIGKYSKN